MTPLLPDPARRREARALLRARRRALSPRERSHAARAALRQLRRLRWLRPGISIAIYDAFDGELDTGPIISFARAMGCRVYLPRITDFRAHRMRFVPHSARRRINRWGLAEPLPQEGLAPSRFGIIIVPLVGFDDRGARLGMGSGFYDRALAFRRWRRAWRGPRIVGLAYGFQRLDRIEEGSHDIRLDAIVTDQGLMQFKERRG